MGKHSNGDLWMMLLIGVLIGWFCTALVLSGQVHVSKEVMNDYCQKTTYNYRAEFDGVINDVVQCVVKNNEYNYNEGKVKLVYEDENN